MLGGIVVLVGLALVLARNLPVLDDEAEDVADNGLPADRLLRSDDIPRLRFRVGLRGYRMSDVDAALEAVRRSLAAAEPAECEEPEKSGEPQGDEPGARAAVEPAHDDTAT